MEEAEILDKLSEIWMVAWVKSKPQNFQGFFAANARWHTDSQRPQK